MPANNNWTAGDVAALIAGSGTLKSPLSTATVAELMENGAIKSFQKGTLFLQRGEQTPRFFVLLGGTARLAAHTVQGREYVSLFIEPGNFWGVHPCLDDVAESHDALAETDVEVLIVPAQQLRNLMWTNREFQEAIVGFLCSRLRLALAVGEQFATWAPRARLAWRILAMVNSHGKEARSGETVEIALSQETLASMINLSRQRTNILLKEFERDGLVQVRYGRLKVLEERGLHAILENPTES